MHIFSLLVHGFDIYYYMMRKKLNLIGKRFGNSIVVKEIGIEVIKTNKINRKGVNYEKHFQLWELQCDCGNFWKSSSRYLTNSSYSHSCGCLRKVNLIGKRFGGGVVIKFFGHGQRGIKTPRSTCIWELQCDCGNLYTAVSSDLTSGTTSSCGCQKLNLKIKGYAKNITQYYNSLKKGASGRNIEFSLEKDFLLEMLYKQKNICRLSGLYISLENGTASIDRINNNIGYINTNIQWIHRKVNYMKNNMEIDDFIKTCKLITEMQFNQPAT
jgi:hypothetical protein